MKNIKAIKIENWWICQNKEDHINFKKISKYHILIIFLSIKQDEVSKKSFEKFKNMKILNNYNESI
jgi:hypothetical protein